MQDRKHKILCLGDSYTIGEGVPEKENFPHQLADALEEQGVPVAAPLVIAKTGWTSGELIENIPDLPNDFDLVTLLIGVNNQYRGLSLSEYIDELKELSEKAVSFAGDTKNKVLLLSIPDYSVTPFVKDRNPEKISKDLEKFNNAVFTVAAELGLPYLNITNQSRLSSLKPDLIAGDQLHYSGEMYKIWVDMMVKKINP